MVKCQLGASEGVSGIKGSSLVAHSCGWKVGARPPFFLGLFMGLLDIAAGFPQDEQFKREKEPGGN